MLCSKQCSIIGSSMIFSNTKIKGNKRGVAIFIAVIAVASLMLISVAISNISYKEQLISQSGRDSRVAFFAADAGAECALFHDLKGGHDAAFLFSTSINMVTDPVICDDNVINADVDLSGNVAVTRFYFNLDSPPEACAFVTVTKTDGVEGIETTIESSGYNVACSGSQFNPTIGGSGGSRNLERTLKITY